MQNSNKQTKANTKDNANKTKLGGEQKGRKGGIVNFAKGLSKESGSLGCFKIPIG